MRERDGEGWSGRWLTEQVGLCGLVKQKQQQQRRERKGCEIDCVADRFKESRTRRSRSQ